MGTSTLNAGSVSDSDIKENAGVKCSKLQHRHEIICNFDLAIDGAPTDKEQVVFVATAACTVNFFKCKVSTGATTGTVAFDLKKNGSTILSGTVDITSTETTAIQTGTISNATLAANDVLSIEMNDTSSDADGPVCFVQIDQAAS